jgi:hypothetical protein
MLVSLGLLMLFPVFFLLHGSNAYFGLIPLRILASMLIEYIVVVSVIFGVSLLLLRDHIKAFVFAGCLLVFYFFFGAVHDFAKNNFPASLSSWKVMLSAWFLLLIVLFFLIRSAKIKAAKPGSYLAFLLVILTLWEMVSMALLFFSNASHRNQLSVSEKLPEKTSVPLDQRPDIYFIVFDEHSSTSVLQEQFGYDNSSLDSALHQNGFFVSSASRSNYNFTPFSLASTFSMNYLKMQRGDSVLNMPLMLKAIHSTENNPLTAWLVQQDYEIINYGFFGLNGVASRGISFFGDQYFRDVINNQTFPARFDRDILWNFSTRNPLTGSRRISNKFLSNKKSHIERHRKYYSGLAGELSKSSAKPRFVYVHFMLPHQPFYQDSLGREVDNAALVADAIPVKNGYLGQVAYVNKLIRQLLPAITKKGGRERVVIIEGDHGFRLFDPAIIREKVFPNLNAIYFSGNRYNQLYDSISPVNSFRVVMNRYFGQQLPLLRDSSIFLRDDEIEGRRRKMHDR